MMAPKTSIADRAAMAMKGQTKPATPAPEEAPAAPAKRKAAATRTEDVRLSVAISPRVYHKLVTYTNVLAMQLGLPRIPHVRVIRALLEELESNSDLADKVAARVIETYETK